MDEKFMKYVKEQQEKEERKRESLRNLQVDENLFKDLYEAGPFHSESEEWDDELEQKHYFLLNKGKSFLSPIINLLREFDLVFLLRADSEELPLYVSYKGKVLMLTEIHGQGAFYGIEHFNSDHKRVEEEDVLIVPLEDLIDYETNGVSVRWQVLLVALRGLMMQYMALNSDGEAFIRINKISLPQAVEYLLRGMNE